MGANGGAAFAEILKPKTTAKQKLYAERDKENAQLRQIVRNNNLIPNHRMKKARTFIYNLRKITVTPRLLGYRWAIVGTDATGIALPLIARALTLDRAISKAMMRVDQLNSR
jgi:hypothetical protein